MKSPKIPPAPATSAARRPANAPVDSTVGALMSMGRRKVLLSLLALAIPGTAGQGCALFNKPPDLFHSAVRKLPAINLPPDTIQLDVVYVERPVGDQLLGPDLWRHVDQLASIEPEARAMLRQNGMRVGVVSSNPPVELQRMLGLKSDFAYEPDAQKSKQLVGHHCFVRSGEATQILTSRPYANCDVEVRSGTQARIRSFENAVCRFRVTAKRLQDGWVQIEFVPQIDHGPEQLRPVAGDGTWRYQDSQRSEVFYQQRFALKLSTGEMAVLTADDETDGSLGQLFFRGPTALQNRAPEANLTSEAPAGDSDPGSGPTVQRLLVVRLAGVGGG